LLAFEFEFQEYFHSEIRFSFASLILSSYGKTSMYLEMQRLHENAENAVEFK